MRQVDSKQTNQSSPQETTFLSQSDVVIFRMHRKLLVSQFQNIFVLANFHKAKIMYFIINELIYFLFYIPTLKMVFLSSYYASYYILISQFFNSEVMVLMEVSRWLYVSVGTKMADSRRESAASSLGKESIICNRSSPGLSHLLPSLTKNNLEADVF